MFLLLVFCSCSDQCSSGNLRLRKSTQLLLQPYENFPESEVVLTPYNLDTYSHFLVMCFVGFFRHLQDR
jgi:hypothetical protein